MQQGCQILIAKILFAALDDEGRVSRVARHAEDARFGLRSRQMFSHAPSSRFCTSFRKRSDNLRSRAMHFIEIQNISRGAYRALSRQKPIQMEIRSSGSTTEVITVLLRLHSKSASTCRYCRLSSTPFNMVRTR